MVPFKLRIIRERNRIYTFLLRLFSTVSGGVEVFIFHDILENKNQVKYPFAISQVSFEQFLLHQIKIGNRPLNYVELKAIIENRKSPNRGFIVSFDDCNSSVFYRALPFLKKHQIPFILFITVDLIGKTNYLTKEQIIEMSKDSLCTIGSHAMSHKMFRYMTENEALIEFEQSQTFLQKLSNQPVDCFAFPYGRLVEVSCQNIRILRKSAYQCGFSAISGNLSQRWFTGKYFLPRINVSEELAQRSFKNNY